jgi:hypothetical protein
MLADGRRPRHGRSLGTLGGFQYGTTTLGGQTTLERHLPAPVETTIGILEPGIQHVITAEYVGGTDVAGCKAGAKIEELRVGIAPQG